VQRFSDGRWLVIEARTEPETSNAFIFAPDKSLIRSFYAGDGIQSLFLDSRDRIWIGYFDEGIFGAFFPRPPKGHRSYDYGPNGLIRLDDHGNIEFGYSRRFPKQFISDIQAMTIDDDGRVWFCPDMDYFLASISGDHVDFVLPKAPTVGADALSVGPSHFAFFGGYRSSTMVAVVERNTQRLRLLQLRRPNGATLSPLWVFTRGSTAVGVSDNSMFKLDLETLLRVLGPWTDGNTSTVASAVQYLDEEESYAGYTILFPAGPDGAQFVPAKPRPPENPPRHDDDSN
jgi:hypothetical protein